MRRRRKKFAGHCPIVPYFDASFGANSHFVATVVLFYEFENNKIFKLNFFQVVMIF